jgi:GTP-binding protein Era
MADDAPPTRCGVVALIGAPNAGKSTLVNALVGLKVCAVSPKTNTTSVPLLGCVTEGDAQVALLDTPGVVGPRALRGPRHARRVASAWATAADADAVLLVVDAARQAGRPDERVTALARALGEGPAGWRDRGEWACPPATLVLNKVDLIPRAAREAALAAVAAPLLSAAPFPGGVLPVSAAKGGGVADLRAALLAAAVPRAWPLPGGAATDRTPGEVAVEIVREKLFLRLRDELPYDVRPVLTSWHDCRDGAARVEVDVLVGREPVRRMVVGRGGAVVGEVGIGARRDLEAVLGRRVHLIVNVKVERGKGGG